MVLIAKTYHQNDKMLLCNSEIKNTLQSALVLALEENRLVVGLSDTVKTLAKAPEDSLFCIMAQPEDSATHMQEVLLEAYCYENGIYVLKVDNSTKLGRIIGTSEIASCVLIQKSLLRHDDVDTEHYSDVEDSLIDHCEAYWNTPSQPIIQLPES